MGRCDGDVRARLPPPSVAMPTLTLNLWLAAKITATSGRLHRPWPDLKTATLPPMALAAALRRGRLCFAGGLLTILAEIITSALMMAYAFTGFAVLHTLTLALKSRAFWLGSTYAIVVLFVWPVLAMVVLGLGRRRVRPSPTLSARQAAAAARPLRIQPFNLTSHIKENEHGSHFAGTRRQARSDGRNRQSQGRFRPQLPAEAQEGAARHRREPRQVRRHEGRARGQQPPGQVGSQPRSPRRSTGVDIVIIRQASETGQLFGSVSVRDIVVALEAEKVTVSRPQVWLDAPIKAIGQQKVTIAVHPEVEASITVTVARSADEAERIKRGEDISTRQEDQDAAAEAIAAAGEFFDPEAQHDDVEQPAAPAEAPAEK